MNEPQIDHPITQPSITAEPTGVSVTAALPSENTLNIKGLRIPLSAKDSSFIALETPTNQQKIAVFCPLSSLPKQEDMTERVAALVRRFPKLGCIIINNNDQGAKERRGRLSFTPDPHFHLEHHVFYPDTPAGHHLMSLTAQVAATFERPLDPRHPQWRVSFFNAKSPLDESEQQEEHGLLFEVHHTIADGLGGLELLYGLCNKRIDLHGSISGSVSESGTRAKTPPTKAAGTDTQTGPEKHPKQKPRGFSIISSAFRLLYEAFSRAPKSPLNGESSPARQLLTIQFPLEPFHTLRRSRGMTINDTFFTLISGTLRRYYQTSSLTPIKLKAIMPVSLRGGHVDESLGNHLTGVGVTLPLQESDPWKRARLIQREVSLLKATGAFGAYALLAVITDKMPRRVRSIIYNIQRSRTNLICTNMPGPRSPLFVGNAEILAEYGMPALMSTQGVSFSLITYGTTVCVSIVVDPVIIPAPETLLACLREEAASLFE